MAKLGGGVSCLLISPTALTGRRKYLHVGTCVHPLAMEKFLVFLMNSLAAFPLPPDLRKA